VAVSLRPEDQEKWFRTAAGDVVELIDQIGADTYLVRYVSYANGLAAEWPEYDELPRDVLKEEVD
jgi:NOL1/NOP2/fmu family ribosome biogenesis protein